MAEISLLRQRLNQLTGRWFAVLDGAQFDDLPTMLFDGDFVHRPLYHDSGVGTRDSVRTAPQLVWLDRTNSDTTAGSSDSVDPKVLDRVFDLNGDRPAAVFWFCDLGGEVLYRHLRTINMVLIPQGTDDDVPFDSIEPGIAELELESEAAEISKKDAPEDGSEDSRHDDDSGETHELVLFRHADANVLAQVIPSLNATQFSRLLGPADEILFIPDLQWGRRVMRVRRPADAPATPVGPLRFDDDAMARLDDRQLDARRFNIIQYIRDVAPELSETSTDDEILSHVRKAETSAGELGIKTNFGIGLWSLMLFITDGEAMHEPDILRALRDGGLQADDALLEMVEQIARAPADHPMWTNI